MPDRFLIWFEEKEMPSNRTKTEISGEILNF